MIGAVVINRTEYHATGTVGLLDTGLEDIGHAGLVSDLTPETILPSCDGTRRGCSHACIARFVGIDPHVCSIRVRTGRYHVRNTLFGAVPRIEELSGYIVTGADLQVVHRFVSLLLGHEVREVAHLGVVISEFLVEGVGDDRRVGVQGQADATQVGCESIVSSFQSRYRYPEGCCIHLVFGILFLYLRPLLSHGGFFLFR